MYKQHFAYVYMYVRVVFPFAIDKFSAREREKERGEKGEKEREEVY